MFQGAVSLFIVPSEMMSGKQRDDVGVPVKELWVNAIFGLLP